MAKRFSVEAVFKAIDRVSAPVSRMQQRLGRFTRSFSRGMRSVNRLTGRATRAVAGLAARFAAASSAAALLGGAALAGLNRSSVEVERLAKSVGGTARSVTGIAGALKGAGFEVDHVVDLMEEMNNKLGESSGLGEEMIAVTESLHILGLEFDRLKRLSPEEQFKAITDAALQMEDAQKAAAAADILMGGEANKIIGVLRQQGRSMDEILARYDSLNLRTEESRRGASAFVDALNETTFVVRILAQEFAGLIGGYLVPLLRRFADWSAANRELIRQRVAEWAEKIVDKIKEFWQNLDETVKWLKRVAAATAAIYGLVAALNAVAVAIKIVSFAMAMTPVGWLIAALSLLTVGIGYLIYKWEAARDVATRFALGVIANTAKAVETVKAAWSGAIEAFTTGWKAAGSFFGDVWDALVDGVRQKIDWITRQFERVQRIAQKVGRFLGITDDSDEDLERRARAADEARQGMSSPQERTARSIEERRSSADLTIRDETGRAELRQRGDSPGIGFSVVPTGAFD